MQKLTFKDYLESKGQLLKAVNETPIRVAMYNVKKYCKLRVGEQDSGQYIGLKPHNKIIVEWKYSEPKDDNPEPICLRFEGVRLVEEDLKYQPQVSGAKLLKWLDRFTDETSD